MSTCDCGCGEIVKPKRRFISGHNTRGVKRPDMLGDKNPLRRRADVAQRQKENCRRGVNHPKFSTALRNLHYKTVHQKLRAERWNGQCEHCDQQARDLALITGHEKFKCYSTGKWLSDDRNDYLELCSPCHGRYDIWMKQDAMQRGKAKKLW